MPVELLTFIITLPNSARPLRSVIPVVLKASLELWHGQENHVVDAKFAGTAWTTVWSAPSMQILSAPIQTASITLSRVLNASFPEIFSG